MGRQARLQTRTATETQREKGPVAAVTAKRLQDRNQPGLLAALLIGPGFIENWLDPAFYGGQPQSGIAHWIYVGAAATTWIIGLWFLIELGFLRGSAGENTYGADPLAAGERGRS